MLDNLGYNHKLRMFNTYVFSTATVVTWTHLSVTLYAHCLSCYVHRITVRLCITRHVVLWTYFSRRGQLLQVLWNADGNLQWRVFAVLRWGWARKVRLCISLLLRTVHVYKKRCSENITATISSLPSMCMCVAFKEFRSFHFSCFA